MRRIAWIALWICFWFGCFSSQTDKRYFQLQISPGSHSYFNKIDKILLIESVHAEGLYDDFRVIYRNSPYQVNYYSYDFWVKKPAVLIKQSMMNFLSSIGVFTRVIDKYSIFEPDLLFKSRLFNMEEVDKETAWYARLSLEIEIYDFRTKKSLWVYRFDRQKPIPKKDVTLLPAVISEILKTELVQVVKKLSEIIR
jgi:ABC-type uncharacterized transport system auxiliary subunit